MTTLSSETTTAPSFPTFLVLEKLDLIKVPWGSLAPQSRFAGMTLTEFDAATQPSLASRAMLAVLNAEMKTGIARRKIADKATVLLIKRVVAGVVGDASHGPDSGLYRAMGFVRASECRTGHPADPARPSHRTPALIDRFGPILLAWTELAPAVSFSGISLAQFIAGAAPSANARAALAAARSNCKAEIAARDDADKVSRDLIKRVVSAVKAEPGFGEDSPLYGAMGYRRASERRPRRRTAVNVPEAPAAPAPDLQPTPEALPIKAGKLPLPLFQATSLPGELFFASSAQRPFAMRTVPNGPSMSVGLDAASRV